MDSVTRMRTLTAMKRKIRLAQAIQKPPLIQSSDDILQNQVRLRFGGILAMSPARRLRPSLSSVSS